MPRPGPPNTAPSPRSAPPRPKTPSAVCTGYRRRCAPAATPRLIPKFKAAKDWCPEHGVPESQCFECHPDLTFDPLPPLPPGADLVELSRQGEDVPALEAHAVKGKVTVFDFYAVWCAPCRKIDAHVFALLGKRGDLAVRKLNVVSWDTPLAARYLKDVSAFRTWWCTARTAGGCGRSAVWTSRPSTTPSPRGRGDTRADGGGCRARGAGLDGPGASLRRLPQPQHAHHPAGIGPPGARRDPGGGGGRGDHAERGAPGGLSRSASCNEVPVQPVYLHDQDIWPAELRPVLELGLTRAFAGEVHLPLRLTRTTSATGARRPPYPRWIPRSTTGTRRWRGSAIPGCWPAGTRRWPRPCCRCGPGCPAARPDRTQPLRPGRRGQAAPAHAIRNRDVRSGAGPGRLPAAGRFSAGGVCPGQASLYQNRHGFRAGWRGLGGAQLAHRLVGGLTGGLGADVMYEGPERWDGEIQQDGNLGRTEILVGLSLVQALGATSLG